MTWEKQKVLKEGRTWEYRETIDKIKNIRKKRDRAFVSLMYLSAGRSTEIIDANMMHVYKTIVRNRGVLQVTLPNRKNKRKHSKMLLIPFDREHEVELADVVLEYVNSCSSMSPFKFTKQRAWQILQKELGINPHWIRHLRLTHLIIVYDFNEHLLVKFAGWTDSRPADSYAEIGIKDFLTKF